MTVMNEGRESLLRSIQIYDFALNDAALYLNMNPNDEMALEFYRKNIGGRKEAADEYMNKYGPLSHKDSAAGERWKWVDGPWPWQNEEEA